MLSAKTRVTPMFRILSLLTVLIAMGALFSCSTPVDDGPKNASPTEAYKRLFEAVKAKDTDAIKRNLTVKSAEMGQLMVDKKMKNTIEEALENGLTATTFSPTLPTIRDERINGNMGSVEVWNSKDSKWEDLPFMLEDGSWKLAWGEQFAGTFVSPGPGRDRIEKEAANAVSTTPLPTIDPAISNAAVANALRQANTR
jgi:hypothetical protein